jgi:hypothetical protein
MNNIYVEYAQKRDPNILNREIVIFLAGPTPQYGGSDPAKFSWRDTFITKLNSKINKKVIVVSPEPETKNWKDTKYGMTQEQITWEHKWLERSNIIVFWHETRWKPNKETLVNCYHGPDIANIGIQFRFEVGLYIANKEKIKIFYTTTCRWISWCNLVV